MCAVLPNLSSILSACLYICTESVQIQTGFRCLPAHPSHQPLTAPHCTNLQGRAGRGQVALLTEACLAFLGTAWSLSSLN